ncbi:MAG TPA: M56 family metallopeptidase [Streptosporangiaceae bacterium]|nr:M56 family metallopeptidase [Streptosporangiaceae bacterium]
MIGAALLTLIAAATLPAAHWLSGAHWTWRAPRTGILLWQALGLAWGVASIGALLAVGLLPYRSGIAGGLADLVSGGGAGLNLFDGVAVAAGLGLGAFLLTLLLYAVHGVGSARRRHRAVLALVARDSGVRGTVVLDHPAAAAYCVPGVRSAKVVVSAGTLELLDQAELAAVLAHERAHVRERHDLVLLPFTSLPRIGLVARCLDAVELLIEMRADDRARLHRSPRELATALLRFAAARPAAAPSGALSAGGGQVLLRVRRLLEPVPPRAYSQVGTVAVAGIIAIVPLLLYVLPR